MLPILDLPSTSVRASHTYMSASRSLSLPHVASSFSVSVSCRPVTLWDKNSALFLPSSLPSSSFFLTDLTARSVTRNETDDDPEMESGDITHDATKKKKKKKEKKTVANFARFGAKQSGHGDGRDSQSKIRLHHTVVSGAEKPICQGTSVQVFSPS